MSQFPSRLEKNFHCLKETCKWQVEKYSLWLQRPKFLQAHSQGDFTKRPGFGIHKLSYMIQKSDLIIKFKNSPITYKFQMANIPKNILSD